MPMYSYKALDIHGKRMKGLQEAANPVDLELQLRHSGLDLISAKPHMPSPRKSKIKRCDLITFFFNLEQLNRAGVPLLECLNDLHDSMGDQILSATIADLMQSIESGRLLSQAMAQHPDIFDQVTLSLVRAGEASGKLSEVFRELIESLKWQDEIAAQTRSMMLYPAFVGIVVLAITFFMMIYLVPQLAGFIKGMGQEIPFHARLLFAASSIFVHYWHFILAAPVIAYGTYRGALRLNPGLRYHIDNLQLHIWPTGAILQKIILARFARTFAMMYSAGINILDCLAHSRDLANNQVIANSLHAAIHEIESGNNLTLSFQHTGIFPPLVLRMLKVGEATGQLDQALLNVSYFYDRDVKDSIRKIQVMLEPAMTIMLGVLLGWVMLSVLSPIYDLIGKVAR